MSDTPRTDEELKKYGADYNGMELVMACFARELERELAAEKEKHRWIPVDERKPKKEGQALCIVGEAFGGPIMRVVTATEGYFWGLFDCERVTHWMPLPNAPEDLK